MPSPGSVLPIVPACFHANAIPVCPGGLSRYQLLFYLSRSARRSELQGTEGGCAIWVSQFNAIGASSSAHLSWEDWFLLLRLAEILLHWGAHGWVPLPKKKVKTSAALLSTAFSNPREERDWLFFILPIFFLNELLGKSRSCERDNENNKNPCSARCVEARRVVVPSVPVYLQPEQLTPN